jgi:hypothetical protein
MISVPTTIEVKFLSICPPSEAVAWLREKRQGIGKLNLLARTDYRHQELALAARNDAYIDFGLARYGTSSEAGKIVYEREDDALRLTLLAHFPNAGFAIIFDQFELADQTPATVEQLSAVVMNPSLSDTMFVSCFEKKGIFERTSEEDFQNILIAAAENPRLITPYDDTFLDGYSHYSYHNVFGAAWELTMRVPATKPWAGVLYQLLYRCLPPVGFDAKPAIARWHFKQEKDEDELDIGYFLRARLADLLEANDELLQSSDGALRVSFYKRFSPWEYAKWPDFAKDTEYFFDGAISNDHLWRKRELREMLSQLCWNCPDPQSAMEKPNMYRGRERSLRETHPEWFADEE